MAERDSYLQGLIDSLQSLPEGTRVLQLQEDRQPNRNGSQYRHISLYLHIPTSVVAGEVVVLELESGERHYG